MRGSLLSNIFLGGKLVFNFKAWLTFVLFLLVFIPGQNSFGANSFSTIKVTPNADLGDYFFVQEAETLPQLGWNVGTSMLYYYRPLDINLERRVVRRTGTTTVTTRNDGMKQLFFEYFYGAFGVTDYISLMLDWPLALIYEYADDFYGFKPGDLRFSAKFRVLDPDKHPVGVAIIPAITFPTGNESHFLGEGNVTGEARVVVEAKPFQQFRLSFNAAFQTGEKVTTANFSYRNIIKLSLGANYKVVENVALIAEVETQTTTNDFFGSRSTTPTEVRAGARWRPNGGPWLIGGGASGGLVYGSGMPMVGGFINVGYTGRIETQQKRVERIRDLFAELGEEDQCVTISANDGERSKRYRVLCSVYFGFNKAKTQDYKVILALTNFIKESQRAVDIEIRGWADRTGSEAYNKKLSLKRATYVAQAITNGLGKKVHKANIRVMGIGEDVESPPQKARRADALLR